ncbi:MAG: SRPBCC domain-containing protein [Candidatus Dojkabacteria bacterium]|nr:MAG: SRPBCC domain-containing protein [Candidatus Dojkabacteria bacterium]
MQKLHYSISINAPVQKVWDTMLQDATYRQWTAAFNPGSYYQGSWDKGAKMLFLGPDPMGGEEGGMVSRIADNRPNEFISIEHLGLVKGGVEDTTSEEAKKWAPAYENYTFTEQEGVTTVNVEMDSLEEHAEMFNDMWPKGLQKLKEMAESN